MNINSIDMPQVKLSLEEQVELGKRMTLYGDTEARDKLILNCIPMVIETAKAFSNHTQVSYDDLFQEGMMGVMVSIERYDYTRNVKFSTFAYTRIVHYLALWIKKQIKYQADGFREGAVNGMLLDSTVETFHSVFRQYPTDSQLAQLLSVPTENVAQIKSRHANPVPASLRLQMSDEKLSSNQAMASDSSTIVEKLLCTEYNRKHLLNALDSLEASEREIIVRRYLYRNEEDRPTLTELADEFGVYPSTIMRRERSGLKKILGYFKENNIEPEWRD